MKTLIIMMALPFFGTSLFGQTGEPKLGLDGKPIPLNRERAVRPDYFKVLRSLHGNKDVFEALEWSPEQKRRD